jgi:hypothetical protein
MPLAVNKLVINVIQGDQYTGLVRPDILVAFKFSISKKILKFYHTCIFIIQFE